LLERLKIILKLYGEKIEETLGDVLIHLTKKICATIFFVNFLLTKGRRRSTMALGKTGKRKEVGEKIRDNR
jgi:hypothetical protein